MLEWSSLRVIAFSNKSSKAQKMTYICKPFQPILGRSSVAGGYNLLYKASHFRPTMPNLYYLKYILTRHLFYQFGECQARGILESQYAFLYSENDCHFDR